MIGRKLAHYEITSHLGTGGMGEVYQATDSKLGRSVAIKLLPEAFTHDAERVERFQREARVLASLNHSNIAAIHGIEEAGGRHFLVLELVPGETLADRIQRGPIPVDEALAIATQIAEALEVAHEAGVVHRDLKPANIKMTPDGNVKVLDFGLAKAMAAHEPEADFSNSPTISRAATQMGVILGTAAYMSPEQARGKSVDRRADIWAFGVVLYEMVTGRRLFKGEDLTDTLAAVVRDKPDVSGAPAAVRRVLEKCLEKDPKKRLRHISGFTLLLENATGESANVVARNVRARSPWLSWVVAGLAGIGLAALAFVHFRETAPELRAVQFSMEAPPDMVFANQYCGVAASPDGRHVVFAAQTRDGGASLWLRPLDSTASVHLPGTEGGNCPTWSPDSKSLAFYVGGKLKRLEIAGGAPLILGDAPNDAVSATGSWNRDGVILLGSSAGLQSISASGGGATLVTRIDPSRKETGHGYPQFMPDGNRFLYFIASGDPSVQGAYAGSLADPGQRRQIVRTAAKAVYVPAHGDHPDYLLWMQEQTLLAQQFNLDAFQLIGNPMAVAEGVGSNSTLSNRVAFWASESGLLTYFAAPAVPQRPVVRVSREGKPLGEVAARDAVARIALAPGAERMAVARTEFAGGQPNLDVWVSEFARGGMTRRLTFNAAQDDFPIWSPDGRQVAFSSNRDGGVFQLYRKDASGAGQEERLTDGPSPKEVLDWSRDGKYLLYRERNPQMGLDLTALPLEGERKPIPVVHTPSFDSAGAISPNGQWVAFASDGGNGRQELFVQAFPGVEGAPSGRWQISNGGAGDDVKWRGDGREIFYLTPDGTLMAAAIQTSPQGILAETPRELFAANLIGSTHEFDVTPDGQRFLLILNPQTEGNGGPDRLTIVSNWQAALPER